MQPRSDGVYEFSDGKDGKVLFWPSDNPAVFAISLELPAGGGNAAGVKFIRECIDTMFNETPALLLYGVILNDNLASKQIASVCQWGANPERDYDKYTYRFTTIGHWIKKRGKDTLAKAEARRPKK